jgi:hypothetical protein
MNFTKKVSSQITAMYVDNANIKLPEDPHTVVWKYLDLSNFWFIAFAKLFMSDQISLKINTKEPWTTFEEIKKLSKDNPDFLNYYKNIGKK